MGRRDLGAPPVSGLPLGWGERGRWLESGRSGYLQCGPGTWASPGLVLRLGASAMAVAAPAPVRAPRGQGLGLGRDRARAAAGPQQSGIGGARRCHRQLRLLSLVSGANALGVWVYEDLQWYPAGLRCHNLAADWRSLRSR